MCALIGYSGKYNELLIEKLLLNSMIRGVHSFGYSQYCEKELVTKKFLDFEEFKRSINLDKPSKFIAHFRYSTSGDFGNQENNQPLQRGNVAMAFNGVISQKSKQEIEAEYDTVLQGDNDGYLLIEKYTDQDFVRKSNITFAAVGLKDGSLFAIRNSRRPLWYAETTGAKVYASTRDIFIRSGIDDCYRIDSIKIHEQ
jgi:glutamine phosphoribosylpyrophosphate amidotransferase